MNRLNKVHITYKHHDKYENDLQAIINGLDSNHIAYSIDKYDILYRQDIREYEKEIGCSDKVIMFIIPEYFYSIDCMFEMTEIFRNGNIQARLYPLINLESIPRDNDGLQSIKTYWQDKKNEHLESAKHEPGGSAFTLEIVSKIDNIIKSMDDFWDFVVHINSGSYEELVADDAHLLMQEILKTNSQTNIQEKLTSFDEIQPIESHRTINQGDKSTYIENFTGTLNIN